MKVSIFLATSVDGFLTLTVIPVVLGEGKPLFNPSREDIKLKLLESKAFDFGFVQNRYSIVKQEYKNNT